MHIMENETVGKVKLNYSCYAGEDLYSDGDIEDEILDIVKNHSRDEYNHIIAERKSWPILYHLSHIRGNIIRHIPMTGDEDVLEVGAGCGAITTALAEKAKSVTCIDLSRKRSLINAYKNSDLDNIEILVGNFEDVEKTLTQKYDIITLIGVFEYAAYYIHTKSPYPDFMKMLLTHLRPNGRIIVAIENRLGFKYFAGCREDHLGTFFEGLEGYPNKGGVQTFSKKEWEGILDECGIVDYTFYYPYPDYKFPLTIYSDKFLPKSAELNNNYMNFDRDRMILFQDDKVLKSLLDNDMFPQFSNSFLIEIRNSKDKDYETVPNENLSNRSVPDGIENIEIGEGA